MRSDSGGPKAGAPAPGHDEEVLGAVDLGGLDGEEVARVCSKCGLPKPLQEFVWDDGIRQGVGLRCAECRSMRGGKGCPECRALWRALGRSKWGRSSKPPRCEPCRAAARLPGLPFERFRIRGHALARFQRRVRPDLVIRSHVLHEMLRLMEHAPHQQGPPPWYASERPDAGTSRFGEGYLLVDPEFVFCLARYGNREVVKVSTVLVADSYVPPPAEPVPTWVTTSEEQYATHVEMNRIAEARLSTRHELSSDAPAHPPG